MFAKVFGFAITTALYACVTAYIITITVTPTLRDGLCLMLAIGYVLSLAAVFANKKA